MSVCKVEKLQPLSTLAAECSDGSALPAAACAPWAPHRHQPEPVPSRTPPQHPCPDLEGPRSPWLPRHHPTPCSPFPPSSASLARKEWL